LGGSIAENRKRVRKFGRNEIFYSIVRDAKDKDKKSNSFRVSRGTTRQKRCHSKEGKMEQLVFDMQPLLDIKQASKILNLSEDWLYRNWKSLPFAFKIGKQIRFDARGMKKWIEEQQNAGNGVQER
jgi:hypothetical protein